MATGEIDEHNKAMALQVIWIVSDGNEHDNGEFGVLVDGEPYFYYKWSITEPSKDVKYRPIHKREFGEVIRAPDPRDAEIAALREERDLLRVQYDAIHNSQLHHIARAETAERERDEAWKEEAVMWDSYHAVEKDRNALRAKLSVVEASCAALLIQVGEQAISAVDDSNDECSLCHVIGAPLVHMPRCALSLAAPNPGAPLLRELEALRALERSCIERSPEALSVDQQDALAAVEKARG